METTKSSGKHKVAKTTFYRTAPVLVRLIKGGVAYVSVTLNEGGGAYVSVSLSERGMDSAS